MAKAAKTREIARDAVRERIALVAINRFKTHGFDRTTIDDITADMGMSTRNYFRYFPSKEDVLLGPDIAFRSSYLIEFGKVVPTADLWDALRIALEIAVTTCSAKETRQTSSDRQALIRATPVLLARQLEMIERLQTDVTDVYLSRGSSRQEMPPWVVSAVVRSAFACWAAVVRDGEASSDAQSVVAALRDVMTDLRPKILDARR